MAAQIMGMDRRVVIVGGAVAVGILGYAWYKNADSGGVVADPIEAAADEYESPLGNSGNNSTGDFGQDDEDRIDTNGEWTQKAVEYLQTVGVEASAASSALGKLLTFKTLTSQEADYAAQAKAAFGEPPQGGPYPIKEGLPSTTAPTPDAPRLHHVNTTREAAILQWSPGPNAATYIVYTTGGRIVKSGITETSYTVQKLKPNTRYSFSVASVNATGKRSGKTSNVVTVKTKK